MAFPRDESRWPPSSRFLMQGHRSHPCRGTIAAVSETSWSRSPKGLPWQSMAERAVLFVDACPGEEIGLVRGDRGWGNVLLLDMSIESHIRQLLLKRHRRVGGCYRRHASRKVEKNASH